MNYDPIASFKVENGIIIPFVVNIGKDLSDGSWAAWVIVEDQLFVIARGRAEVQPLAYLVGMQLA